MATVAKMITVMTVLKAQLFAKDVWIITIQLMALAVQKTFNSVHNVTIKATNA